MNTSKSLKILFTSTIRSPFVLEDLEFLKNHFFVNTVLGSGSIHALRLVIYCLRSDIVFCWFASVYSFIVVLVMGILKRKSIIVVGGVDVAKDENLKYGIWLSPWKSILIRFALRYADRILVVHANLFELVKARAHYDGKNIQVVPTGYDPEYWTPASDNIKQPIILTIAQVDDERRLLIKGIDLFIEVARQMPQCKFKAIGISQCLLKSLDLPSNVEVLPVLNRSELKAQYQQAKVYCQPSRHEGLSNALCEAMLCGCIPVATDVGGSRDAVGDSGYVVPPSNVHELALAIQKALCVPDKSGLLARKRISDKFVKSAREEAIANIIENLAQ